MVNKKRLILLSVFLFSLLFIINEVNAQYSYSSSRYGYYGSSVGGYFGRGGLFSLLDLYNQYPTWFDFGIFLVIFLGLGKAILGEKFGTAGGKAVYVGLGILLAFSLLLWEQESGFTLIAFGPIAFFLLMLVIAFFIFKWIREAAGSDKGGTLIGVSVAYFFIRWYVMSSFGYFTYGFLTPFTEQLGPILTLVDIGMAVALIIGVFNVLSGRE